MVDERVEDGHRIAELLASELHGRADGGLDRVTVTDADPDVEPSTDGTLAYRVTADGQDLASVYVHPGRARVDVAYRPDAAAAAIEEAAAGRDDVRVRPAATRPPRTVVLVESGAATKAVADALGRLALKEG